MSWPVRKNAAPAPAAHVREAVAAAEKELAVLTAERAEIEAVLPELTENDPMQAAEGHARLVAVERELPIVRERLRLLSDGLAAAERRERAETLEADKRKFDAASAKLARRLEVEWNKHASALADLLRAIEANDIERDRIGQEARELGVPGAGDGAEFIARRERLLEGGKSLSRAVELVGLDGRTI